MPTKLEMAQVIIAARYGLRQLPAADQPRVRSEARMKSAWVEERFNIALAHFANPGQRLIAPVGHDPVGAGWRITGAPNKFHNIWTRAEYTPAERAEMGRKLAAGFNKATGTNWFVGGK
jgi:hypothetical protein